jgi:hypothetical protein
VAWLLYSRRGCHLCEVAEDMLGPAVVVIDVDADPATRERFGLRVPVLEVDGLVVAEGRFDEAAIARLRAGRASET